jgi:hypothetical protein
VPCDPVERHLVRHHGPAKIDLPRQS